MRNDISQCLPWFLYRQFLCSIWRLAFQSLKEICERESYSRHSRTWQTEILMRLSILIELKSFQILTPVPLSTTIILFPWLSMTELIESEQLQVTTAWVGHNCKILNIYGEETMKSGMQLSSKSAYAKINERNYDIFFLSFDIYWFTLKVGFRPRTLQRPHLPLIQEFLSLTDVSSLELFAVLNCAISKDAIECKRLSRQVNVEITLIVIDIWIGYTWKRWRDYQAYQYRLMNSPSKLRH